MNKIMFLILCIFSFACRFSEPVIKRKIVITEQMDSIVKIKQIGKSFEYFSLRRVFTFHQPILMGKMSITHGYDSIGRLLWMDHSKKSQIDYVEFGHRRYYRRIISFDTNGNIHHMYKSIYQDKGLRGYWVMKKTKDYLNSKRIKTINYEL